MAQYKFQFKTGNVCDGLVEIKVNDFIGEVKDGKMNRSLALTIEANGGQLVPDPVKPKAKKRETKPVKWPDEAKSKEGEK